MVSSNSNPSPAPEAAGETDLRAEVLALRADLDVVLKRADQERRQAQLRAQGFGVVLVLVIVGSLVLPVASPAVAQGYGITLEQLLTRVEALEAKTASMSASTVLVANGSGGTIRVPTVRFTGVNLQVLNGTGSTGKTNGAGNLIIGYNEGPLTDQSGSHNLVIGDQDNYSKNAFGGAVIGQSNAILGNYSTVMGGISNAASGEGSSVSGGNGNSASGLLSSVSGGSMNTAAADYSGVSGGTFNSARGRYSSVTAGVFNGADGDYSSITGGEYNAATGAVSSISGGSSATQSNQVGWIGGGYRSP